MTKSSEARRQMIETTALQLFAKRGYTDVSVRDIAQACGIGESALYRHMTSKEDLAVRVFRDAYLGFGQEMLAHAGKASGLEEKLSAYLEVMLKGFDQDPLLLRFLLIRQHDTLAKAISFDDVTPLTVVRDAIVEGIASGEASPGNPDLATALVMGAALQPMTFMMFGRIASPAISHHASILEGLTRLLRLK
jgi:AcrR family transcriptional regulator